MYLYYTIIQYTLFSNIMMQIMLMLLLVGVAVAVLVVVAKYLGLLLYNKMFY